jgi:hypothetical protein
VDTELLSTAREDQPKVSPAQSGPANPGQKAVLTGVARSGIVPFGTPSG